MNEWEKTLRPANGLHIVDPATSRALVEEGARVRGNAEYWMRRLRDGDVLEVNPTPDATPASTTASASKGTKS